MLDIIRITFEAYVLLSKPLVGQSIFQKIMAARSLHAAKSKVVARQSTAFERDWQWVDKFFLSESAPALKRTWNMTKELIMEFQGIGG